MQIHEAKYRSKVRIIDNPIKTPPLSLEVKKGDVLKVLRLDGMYCNCINENGDRVYVAGWTEVEQL
jgi:hypothetical protein